MQLTAEYALLLIHISQTLVYKIRMISNIVWFKKIFVKITWNLLHKQIFLDTVRIELSKS